MSAPRIEANYEMLETVIQKFTQQGDAVEQMLQNVRNHMEDLRNEWIGEGSEAFFNEMDDLVLPGVNRLCQALAEASQMVKDASDTMSDAEEEAANGFQVCI